MSDILVGTCSWTAPTLIESGRFYPASARSAEARLKYYCQQESSKYYRIAQSVKKFNREKVGILVVNGWKYQIKLALSRNKHFVLSETALHMAQCQLLEGKPNNYSMAICLNCPYPASGNDSRKPH